MAEPGKASVLQPVDQDAVRLARILMRTAHFGALASLDPASGHPMATRVAVATDGDGTPVILISALSAHHGAIIADPRCGLLLGEPGKGDPLAHPRMSITCTAQRIDRSDPRREQIARRYLNRHPKAQLYVDFADFAFFRLDPSSASLNGGFARAYALARGHLILDDAIVAAVAAAEQEAIDRINQDLEGSPRVVGIDAEGVDLRIKDQFSRAFFNRGLVNQHDLRQGLNHFVQPYVECPDHSEQQSMQP